MPVPPKIQVLLLNKMPELSVRTPLAAPVSTVMLRADSEAEMVKVLLPATEALPALLSIR